MRRDIIALVIDDQIFLAISDHDPPGLVDMADVASMKPAVNQHPRGLRLIAPISVHDEFAAHEDFAIIGNFDLNALKRRADRLHLERWIKPVARNDRRGLSLTIALQQGDPKPVEKYTNVRV